MDWCIRCRAAAHARYGNKLHRVGPRWYRAPQIAVLILLGRKLGLGPDGLRWLLGRRKDLLNAIGLVTVPGARMFEDAQALLLKAEPTPRPESEMPARRPHHRKAVKPVAVGSAEGIERDAETGAE